jgi:Zn-dependent membrane protease YugP
MTLVIGVNLVREQKMLTQQEHEGAKDALTWAARTYVVAALGSIYFIVLCFHLYGGGSRRD